MYNCSLALETGADILIPELKITLHQPNLLELSFIGEPDLFTAIRYLTLEKELFLENQQDVENLSNFQVLMLLLQQQEAKEKKNNLISLLSLLFPDYRINITPNSIILNLTGFPPDKTPPPVLIDNDNFAALQDVARKVFNTSTLFGTNNVVYRPQGQKAEKIAQRLYETRAKVQKIKAAQNQKTEESGLLAHYISLIAAGFEIPVTEVCKYTFRQLVDQVERFTLKEDWKTDFQIRLTGTKTDKQPDNWMKDLYS